MSFTTVEFILVFLPLSYIAFRAFGRSRTALLAISAVFLAFFGAGGFASVAAFCLANHIILKFYSRDVSSRGRFWGAVAFNAAFLCLFKYFQDAIPGLAPFAPVGISYFTFRSLSLIIDAGYKKVDLSKTGFFDFVFYVVYFPALVAGPISRFRELSAPDPGKAPESFLNDGLAEGIFVFLKGAVCKVLIADPAFGYFAARSAETATLSAGNCALSIFAYSIYIYYDFLGYNLMAIGVSSAFGVGLPRNFDSPYLKRNIVEFWNSWHMTLSFWLRDYIFNPLGQALLRKKFFRDRGLLASAICYIATFALCGAWHGATAGFVAWGLYHGIMLTSYKAVQSFEKKTGLSKNPSYMAFFEKTGFAITFAFVSAGWVFFMFPEPGRSFAFLGRLFAFSAPFDPKGLASIARPMALAAFLFYDGRRKDKGTFEDAAAKFVLAGVSLNCLLSLSNARAFLYGGF